MDIPDDNAPIPPTSTRLNQTAEAAAKFLRESFSEEVRLFLVHVRTSALSYAKHEAATNDLLLRFARYFPAPSPGASEEVRQVIAQAVSTLESVEAISWSADHASNKADVLAKLKAFLSKPASDASRAAAKAAARELANQYFHLSAAEKEAVFEDIIWRHFRNFSAPSPGASGEVREAIEKEITIYQNCTSGWIHERDAFVSNLLAAITPFLSKPAAPMLPGGTLVDGKDGERLRWVENHLQQTGDAPVWDDNGFWHVRINGKNITGTEFTHCIDAAMSAQADAGRDEKPASDAGREEN